MFPLPTWPPIVGITYLVIKRIIKSQETRCKDDCWKLGQPNPRISKSFNTFVTSNLNSRSKQLYMSLKPIQQIPYTTPLENLFLISNHNVCDFLHQEFDKC